MSWEVTKALPESKSRGPSRRPRASKSTPKGGGSTAGHRKASARRGSSGRGPTSKAAGHDRGPRHPQAEARSRARAQLRRACEFQGWIDAEPGRTSADLARHEGLTRARVCQILRLCRLAPQIVAAVEAEGEEWVPSERELREVAGIDGAAVQLVRYRELATGSGGPARVRPTPGFREEFARARRYQAMWESGEFESLEALGRAEGITGSRVSQILYLLQLAPEIIDLLDVPIERVPAGVTKVEVRRISRVRDIGAQRREFAKLCGRRAEAAARAK